jgi:hypothetical protein
LSRPVGPTLGPGRRLTRPLSLRLRDLQPYYNQLSKHCPQRKGTLQARPTSKTVCAKRPGTILYQPRGKEFTSSSAVGAAHYGRPTPPRPRSSSLGEALDRLLRPFGFFSHHRPHSPRGLWSDLRTTVARGQQRSHATASSRLEQPRGTAISQPLACTEQGTKGPGTDEEGGERLTTAQPPLISYALSSPHPPS